MEIIRSNTITFFMFTSIVDYVAKNYYFIERKRIV